jgi:hypothetical protein
MPYLFAVFEDHTTGNHHRETLREFDTPLGQFENAGGFTTIQHRLRALDHRRRRHGGLATAVENVVLDHLTHENKIRTWT